MASRRSIESKFRQDSESHTIFRYSSGCGIQADWKRKENIVIAHEEGQIRGLSIGTRVASQSGRGIILLHNNTNVLIETSSVQDKNNPIKGKGRSIRCKKCQGNSSRSTNDLPI